MTSDAATPDPRLAQMPTTVVLAVADEGPQPIMRDLPQAAPYPRDALGSLAVVANAIADTTQAPFAIAAQAVPATASLAVQAFVDVETLGGGAPTSLFALTIAESGERKSSCDRFAMQGVRAQERRLEADHRQEVKRHKAQRDSWEE